MRFAIYDGIVETHVASSLERAMLAAGHDVYNTGKIGHGFKFATNAHDLHRLGAHLERMLEWEPDVIFVFRPASLPYNLLRRAKSTGARLMVWLSDDPVLWDLTYGPLLDEYDLVLHCGTERVLRFYEEQFGRPTGVNVPFWTDPIAFPKVFGSETRETDALFLGNVHDAVRRRRYFDLGTLQSSVRIHGSVGTDYYNLSGGFLDSDQEVVQAGARAAVAINIPQFFKDHYGLETWFPGLDSLGFFQYPSRVIQYAAMGLPIISLVPSPEDLGSFPEIATVGSMSELDAAIHRVANSPDLPDLSARTHQRFLDNYSAASRVLAIESLLVDESWRTLNAADRTDWFLQFVPAPSDHSKVLRVEAPSTAAMTAGESIAIQPVAAGATQPKKILVVGAGFRRVTSSSAVTSRALRNLGHDVRESDAWNNPFLVPDPNGQFKYVLNIAELRKAVPESLDIIFVTDIDFGLTQSAADALNDSGTRICILGASFNSVDAKLRRLASRATLVCVNNPQVAQSALDHGLRNVPYVPAMVDKAFIDLMAHTPNRRNEPLRIARRMAHLRDQAPAFRDLDEFGGGTLVIEESPAELQSLERLVDVLNVAVILAAHDSSRPGPLPSELLPFALASGALVVTPRGVGPMHLGEPGVEVMCVREVGELQRKLARLAQSANLEAEKYVTAAQRLASTTLLAEILLSGIMTTIFAATRTTESDEESSPVRQKLTAEPTFTLGRAIDIDSLPEQKSQTVLRVEVHHSVADDLEGGIRVNITSLATGDTVTQHIQRSDQITIAEFHFPHNRVDGRIRVSASFQSTHGAPADYRGRVMRMSWHSGKTNAGRQNVLSASPGAQLYRCSNS